MARKNEISPEHYFSLCTGVMIKDIKELAFALDYLSEEELNQHVNAERNDFSTWIRDVYGEEKLAKHLWTKQEKKDIQIALLKHIVGQEY